MRKITLLIVTTVFISLLGFSQTRKNNNKKETDPIYIPLYIINNLLQSRPEQKTIILPDKTELYLIGWDSDHSVICMYEATMHYLEIDKRTKKYKLYIVYAE